MRVEVIPEIDRSIKALESALSGAQNSPDRLPGLVAIINRLPGLFFEEIRSLTYLQPKVTLVELSAGRFSEKCPIPSDATAAVVRAEKLKGSLLFTADCEAGFAFLEAAFGYDAIQPSKTPMRSVTTTENEVLRVLFRRLARSFTNAFSLLVDVTFEIEAARPPIEIETICRAGAPVVAVRLMVEYAGRAGYITIAIPQTLLVTIRPYLSIAPPSEMPVPHINSDPEWTRKLSDEIARAFVSVTAILDEALVPLETIACFSIGSTVELSVESISMARLEFDGMPRYWCELGRSDGGLMLRIKSEYDNEEESIDELCSTCAVTDIPLIHGAGMARPQRQQGTRQENAMAAKIDGEEDVSPIAQFASELTPSVPDFGFAPGGTQPRETSPSFTDHDFEKPKKTPASQGTSEGSREFIMDLPVTMKVVLGSATMPVAAVSKLARGSIVKLDKKVGDPVDILVNGRLVARGEVVVLDELSSRFGVTLTQVGGLPNSRK